MKKIFLFSIFAIYLGSCSDSKLPKYVELTDLRVLTLIADKPELLGERSFHYTDRVRCCNNDALIVSSVWLH